MNPGSGAGLTFEQGGVGCHSLAHLLGQGLQAGQRVAVDGQYRLHPGAKVVEAKPARHAKPAAAGAHA